MSQLLPIDAPDHPHAGLRVFSYGKDTCTEDLHPLDRWCLGTCHTVARVNGRSFYVHTDGLTVRRLLVEWPQWLAQIQARGWVWLLSGEDDSRGWQRLRPLPPDPLAAGGDHYMGQADPDRYALDQRFQRAVHQVLGQYRLDRVDDADGQIVVTIDGGDRRYRVLTQRDWAEAPRCDCPDATQRPDLHAGFCKHVVAVLLRWPDLRCQLLTAIL